MYFPDFSVRGDCRIALFINHIPYFRFHCAFTRPAYFSSHRNDHVFAQTPKHGNHRCFKHWHKFVRRSRQQEQMSALLCMDGNSRRSSIVIVNNIGPFWHKRLLPVVFRRRSARRFKIIGNSLSGTGILHKGQSDHFSNCFFRQVIFGRPQSSA